VDGEGSAGLRHAREGARAADRHSPAGGWFPAKVLSVGPKEGTKVQFLHVINEDGKHETQLIKTKGGLRPKPPAQPYADWSRVEAGLIVEHLCASRVGAVKGWGPCLVQGRTRETQP